MREHLTNAGKKEQRQVNQLLDKQAKENSRNVRDVNGRMFRVSTSSKALRVSSQVR
jgi:hypothetical protein